MRAIIKNKDWKAIQEAARNGNEKAIAIIQRYGDPKSSQEDLDRMVLGFYEPEAEPIKEEITQESAPEPEPEPKPDPEPEPIALDPSDAEPEAPTPVDISKLLDDDLDGLLDKNEISEFSFRDFIKNKKKDGLRAKKNREHFAVYDPDGKKRYVESKSEEYNHSFDNARLNNERKFKDIDGAIGGYIISVGDLPDDGADIDDAIVSEIYDKITDDDAVMGAFGRSWDQDDDGAMKATLQALVRQYGKANVLATLNTLKADNCAYRDYRNGQFDQEAKRYAKSLEDLLK